MSHPSLLDVAAAEVRRLSPGLSVQVSVDGAIVTLQGEAPDDKVRRRIEQGLLRLSEVQAVRNFLRIAPPPGDVGRQLRSLLAGENIQIADLQVEARRGELTLRGHAQGWFDRDAAERLAWSLPGVRGVANQIELPPGAVEPDSPRSGA